MQRFREKVRDELESFKKEADSLSIERVLEIWEENRCN